MKPIDIAIIVTVAVLFAAALGYVLYRKIRHKGGCCDCGDCSSCGACANKCDAKNEKQVKSECCCCGSKNDNAHKSDETPSELQ